ncbi:MAG: MBL fold metallo-hydrolase [Myxococcota bacterium]|nr:MBL fold metallo-hydrolase [Deltaproteobacteria bacterium]MDQ3333944.1 MBL fold metallo-hydrolase [Myxococcota bacterium]
MPSRTALLALLASACTTEISEPIETDSAITCWIETAHRDVPIFGAVTASGVLVRHPDGDLLIDGGNSTHMKQEIEVYSGGDKLFLETISAQLAPMRPLPDALAAAGLPNGELDLFLPSHIHIDHVGGLIDLPDVPVLMPAAELAVMQRGLAQTIFEVVPAHAQRIAPLARQLVFDGPPIAVFGESADIFGDGSVIVVPLPGHTPGSVGTFFNVGTTRVFHVGDAVSTLDQIDANTGKQFPMNRTDSDPDVTLETVNLLHALHAFDPALKIVPAHDRVAWEQAFGAPGACR